MAYQQLPENITFFITFLTMKTSLFYVGIDRTLVTPFEWQFTCFIYFKNVFIKYVD